MLSENSILTNGEIEQMFFTELSVGEALAVLVTTLGNRLEVDVCSIYLSEKTNPTIVLAATVGLNQNCIGKLRMGFHEGLAGLVAERTFPVVVKEAVKHPRFKYFPEAEEDAYASFLGVPIQTLGVLVVQSIEPRDYSAAEVSDLANLGATIGDQLAKASIENCAASFQLKFPSLGSRSLYPRRNSVPPTECRLRRGTLGHGKTTGTAQK